MKTKTFISNQTQWFNGELIQKGTSAELTKEQEKELAPPYGNAFSPKVTELKVEEKGEVDGGLDRNKRKRGSAAK